MRMLVLLATLAMALPIVGREQVPKGQAASDQEEQTTKKSTSNQACSDCLEVQSLRRSLQQINAEVFLLKKRVAELEKEQLPKAIQEQLEKEEQRGEALQLHLLEIAEKAAPLSARLDQINQQLRPETIDATLAGVGSVRPEDLRDEVRKRLLNERIRIQSLLDLLRQDQHRTEASLATTDAAIRRLKQKLAEALRH